jgi:GH24 family phage-related lysozyme (muramidase)
MKTSTNGRKFIEQWEGLILHTYDDSTGVLTIGYGHTTAAGNPVVRGGMAITQQQADQILAQDLKKVEDQVNSLVKVKLTQNQFDALVSYQFNTGALARSSALKYLNQGQYEQASKAMTLYNRGGGKVMQGLVNRRTAEQHLFNTPDAPSVATATTGGVVVGGAAATATAPSHLWPWIIVGTIVAAIVAYIVISIYEFNKQKKEITNVAISQDNNQPVVG